MSATSLWAAWFLAAVFLSFLLNEKASWILLSWDYKFYAISDYVKALAKLSTSALLLVWAKPTGWAAAFFFLLAARIACIFALSANCLALLLFWARTCFLSATLIGFYASFLVFAANFGDIIFVVNFAFCYASAYILRFFLVGLTILAWGATWAAATGFTGAGWVTWTAAEVGAAGAYWGAGIAGVATWAWAVGAGAYAWTGSATGA